MSFQENWTRWIVPAGVPQSYLIGPIYSSEKTFKFGIYTPQSENSLDVYIQFGQPIHAYRDTDESYRWKIFDDLKTKYGTSLGGLYGFFKVENSSYIQRFANQKPLTELEKKYLQHFAFLAAESIIDVLSMHEPIFEFVENTF